MRLPKIPYVHDVTLGVAPRRVGGAGRLVRLILLAIVTLALSMQVVAATLYRYINEKGFLEIGYSVPPELAPNGYDVIDEAGRLLRTVAPQLSEEDYAAKLERDRKLEACEYALERVRRRYENLADIDKAEQAFEGRLAESQKNIQANLDYTNTELAKQQAQAASLERAGQLIPKNLVSAIETSQESIQALTAQKAAGEESAADQALVFEEERRVFQLESCDEEGLAAAN
ncbi:MAG TPA: hypothetical protein VIS76_01490 [Pseudomonadales bacterium]